LFPINFPALILLLPHISILEIKTAQHQISSHYIINTNLCNMPSAGKLKPVNILAVGLCLDLLRSLWALSQTP